MVRTSNANRHSLRGGERTSSPARPAWMSYEPPEPMSRAGSGAAPGSALRLLLADHQVYHPAPAAVRAGTAAVVEDVGVVAPRVLERVGQDRHRAEVPGCVHLLRQGESRRGSQVRREDDRPERVADDVAEDHRLPPGLFGAPTAFPSGGA